MKNKWIVIEGDNGTGKDVLAEKLLDYKILNRRKEIIMIEKTARKASLIKKIDAFLDYNKTHVKYARELNYISLRYWPSTLAGGYADNLLTEKEFRKLIDKCLFSLEKPDLFICLICDYIVRMKRIKKRLIEQPELMDKDNLQKDRAERHYKAMLEISNYFPNWYFINTTNLSKEEVYKISSKIIEEHYEDKY